MTLYVCEVMPLSIFFGCTELYYFRKRIVIEGDVFSGKQKSSYCNETIVCYSECGCCSSPQFISHLFPLYFLHLAHLINLYLRKENLDKVRTRFLPFEPAPHIKWIAPNRKLKLHSGFDLFAKGQLWLSSSV